jgi:hypothetical protein
LTPCLALLSLGFSCVVGPALLVADGRRRREERRVWDGGLPVVVGGRRAGRRGVFIVA